jgi:peptidoglycan/xylan/chitin deacetylase (PgdA/CDA1 family)
MAGGIQAWPNGKRIAVAVNVLFEAWTEGKAPTYSVQATPLKPGTVDLGGAAWVQYGGRVGVWRVLRTLDRLRIPGTFFTSARCTELYPDAVAEIVRAGHDVAGHGYTQDQIPAYMTPEEERASVRRSVEMLTAATGKPPKGWLSPVLAFTPHTADFLAEAGLEWHSDVTYLDLPHRIHTKHGPIAGIPNSDFTDNRVIRTSPRIYGDVHKGTFDYLYRHEPMALLVLTLHCQFGGRPLMIAVFEEVVRYIAQFPDVWFARHGELARWALDGELDEVTYAARYFAK